MRLTTVLLIATLMQVSASTFGQRITINERKANFERVLKSIRSQSGYDVLMDRSILKKTAPIDVAIKDATIDDAMKSLLKDLPLKYSIDGKIIVIEERAPSFLDRIVDRFNAIDVRGVVVDSLGNPLQGATVKVKGSSTQVNTSDKGRFYIANLDENAVLVVSYVGYVSREVKAEKDLGMIRLVMASADLEEVAVVSTGYQDIPKERATGSFVLIDNKMLNQQTGTNILKRLEGITSGLAFDNKSNESGRRKLNLTIRGVSSINGPLDPLVVLDGFIYEGKIENINPNDIENITVLKDAAAASIWGARAGNGVIVITSKRGKFNQKMQLNFNSTVTISQKPDLFKLPQISSSDYIDVEKTLFDNGYYNDLINFAPYAVLSPAVEIFLNRNGHLSGKDSTDQINYLKGLDVRNDYSKYYYRNALTQQYSIGFNGGNNTNAYVFSMGYDRNMNEIYDQYNKLNVKLENTYKPIENLQFNLGVYYTDSKSIGGRLPYNRISYGDKKLPYLSFTDQSGNQMPLSINYRKSYLDSVGSGKLLDWQYHPLEDYKHSTSTSKLQELYTNLGMQYKIFDFLNLDLKYQYQRQTSENEQLNDGDSYYTRNAINTFTQIDPVTKAVKYFVPKGGIRRLGYNAGISHTLRGQFNFSEKFGESLITALIGSEIREAKSAETDNVSYGYSEDPLSISNVDFVNFYPEFLTGSQNYIGGPSPGSNLSNRFISYYTNIAYEFKDRYIFSASARRDGANIFGANTNDKWKPLWSTGLSWKISQEDFFRSGFLSILSLRATYGKSGNVDLRKSALPTAGYFLDPATNLPAAVIYNINDPSLRWEQVKMFNAGLDFSLRNKILSGSIEYFQKDASDLYGPSLYDYSTWGRLSLITKNVADMRGKGIEILLNSKNIDRTFKWQTTLIFNYINNKTTKYEDPSSSVISLITTSNLAGTAITPVVGRPLYSIAAYKWGGLDANGKPQGYVDGKLSTDYPAIRKEAREKGIDGNIVYLGSALPVHYGSLINSFDYKNLRLSVNVSYKFGYYFKKSTVSYLSLVSFGEGHSDFAKRWQKSGDELTTSVPKFDYLDYGNVSSFYGQSEVNVLKGDHIRLQYINLNYSFGKGFLTGNSLKNIQLYLNASNLGILWRANHEGLDPDFSSGLPPLKTFAIGFKGSF